MNAVDTNILIYVHDQRDPNKQRVASELVIGLSDGLLLWQVVCEFLSASRKLAPLGFDFDLACDTVREWMKLWACEPPTWKVLDRAIFLTSRSSLSHWDSLLIAACLEAGVETLYSEGFGGQNVIDGLEVVNPFHSAT